MSSFTDKLANNNYYRNLSFGKTSYSSTSSNGSGSSRIINNNIIYYNASYPSPNINKISEYKSTITYYQVNNLPESFFQ